VRQGRHSVRQGRRLGRQAAALLLFSGHVHLQQHPHAHPHRRRALVQLLREGERVERVHQRKPPGDVLRLVTLEVPDQVPRRAAPGRRVDFLERLLHPVFAQVGEARRARRHDGIRPEAFGHGDDRHRVRQAGGPLPPRDLGPHVGQPLGQGPKIHNRGN